MNEEEINRINKYITMIFFFFFLMRQLKSVNKWSNGIKNTGHRNLRFEFISVVERTGLRRRTVSKKNEKEKIWYHIRYGMECRNKKYRERGIVILSI